MGERQRDCRGAIKHFLLIKHVGMANTRLLAFLTGKWSAGGGVEAVAAVSAVAAGDVIVGVFGCRERRAVVHLFISSFEAEGRPCLHGNSVSEGTEQHTSSHRRHTLQCTGYHATFASLPGMHRNDKFALTLMQVTKCYNG